MIHTFHNTIGCGTSTSVHIHAESASSSFVQVFDNNYNCISR